MTEDHRSRGGARHSAHHTRRTMGTPRHEADRPEASRIRPQDQETVADEAWDESDYRQAASFLSPDGREEPMGEGPRAPHAGADHPGPDWSGDEPDPGPADEAPAPEAVDEALSDVPVGGQVPLNQTSRAYYIPSATYGDLGSVERSDPRSGKRVPTREQRQAESRRANRVGGIVAIIVLTVIVLTGGWLWWTRPLALTLNGTGVQAPRGTSIQKLMEENNVSVTPGNLVSVAGNVIGQGQGEALSASVDGRDLSQDQIASYGVKGGEDIEVGDGADVTEDYDATTTEVQPKLRMDGGYGAFAYVSQWGYPGTVETRTGKVSGETAEVTTKEVQDCVIYLHNVKPDNGQKLVALTFDDGPSSYTQTYLDILAKYNAKATFFQLGTEIEANPALSKAVADAGCQVASHTSKHQQLSKLDQASLQEELSTAFADLKDATGVETTFMRPPYGDFTEGSWLRSGGLMSASIIWNEDSEDWKRPGVDKIVSNCLSGVEPGSIILMHDGGGNRDQDVEALPQIIEQLQSQGYQLVTINDLIASDSSIPADIKTADAKLPDGAVWPTEVADQ